MSKKENDGYRRPINSLKPGEKITGTVTRTEKFGAFIDVGSSAEGFIHISKLSNQKVNRVNEVVNIGDQVQVWVSKVDNTTQRLELSMIRPVTLKWRDIHSGLKTKGEIVRLEKFGAFVDIGAERPGMIHVSELSNEYVSDPAEIVKVGQEIEVSVLEVDRKKRQIRLSAKAIEVIIEEEEPDEKLPTAMELALRAAMEEHPSSKPAESASKTPVRNKSKEIHEELLQRTLRDRMKTSSTDQ